MATQTERTGAVQDVVANLKLIGLPPDWDVATNRLVALVYRELAKGNPIDPTTIDALIADAGLDLEVGREFVSGVSEKDDSGNVVGAVGLSQNQYAHKFQINGVDLTTWCAWDTLFIARTLGQTASVTSYAPGSGNEVTLEINATGADATPSGAVVSFVLLDPEQIDMDSMESVYMVFCHQIFFFPSREEAEAWAADSEYKFAILSVDEAYEVGAIAFANLIEAARG